MARLQHALDLCGRGRHHGGVFHGEIEELDAGGLQEIAAHRVGDEHGVIDDLRLAESFDALLEGADDGEGQSGELDDFADSGLRRTVDVDGHLLGDHADFVVGLGIFLIEESSRRDHQVAHLQVFGIDAEDGDVFFFAVADGDAVGERGDGRGGDDARNDLLDGVEIVDGERVGVGVADVRRAAQILSPDFVGADGLDLVEHELPAGHSDGDDENERRSADDHAKRGEDEADLVAAKSVVGKRDDLAEGHLRAKAGTGWGGGCHCLLFTDATARGWEMQTCGG